MRSFTGCSAAMPLLVAAALARRTTPGPKSTRYGVSFTTIAVAGPDRSGVGPGVPVPRRTILVCAVVRAGGCAAVVDVASTANAATMILDEPGTSRSLRNRGGPVDLNSGRLPISDLSRRSSRHDDRRRLGFTAERLCRDGLAFRAASLSGKS